MPKINKFQTLDGKPIEREDINIYTFTGIEIHADGTKYYYKDGELHREDGPAYIEPNGTYEWRLEGKTHRFGGPAIEFFSGAKFSANVGKKYYYVFNNPCSKEEHDLLHSLMKLKGLI